jgi:hypothetical protein
LLGAEYFGFYAAILASLFAGCNHRFVAVSAFVVTGVSNRTATLPARLAGIQLGTASQCFFAGIFHGLAGGDLAEKAGLANLRYAES